MVGDIFQPTHLLFVLVVALLVLGPKRLPEVAKTLGKGIRDFRGAISGDSDHPNPVSSYLSGDSSTEHTPSASPVSEPSPMVDEPTPSTPVSEPVPAAPVSETPATPPAPTPATTGPPAVADPQPVQPVDEPQLPIVTPAATAPAPPSAPQPAPVDAAATQVHSAASSGEQHD